MSKIALTPNATGTGVFTISSPATNTDRTLTLPDEAGSIVVNTATGIDVTGTVTADGLNINAGASGNFGAVISGATQYSSDALRLQRNGVAAQGMNVTTGGESVVFDSQNTGSGGLHSIFEFKSTNETTTKSVVKFDGKTNDISFYEDTGTTAKFFWDASAESLGIGTGSPTANITIDKGLGGSSVTTFTTAKSYLQLGVSDYNSSGGVYAIGFGYSGGATHSPAYIGLQQTATGSYTKGDLVFRTRSTTTDVEPPERMRIDSSGNLLVGETSTGAVLNSTGGTGAYISADGQLAVSNVSNRSIFNRKTTDGDILEFRKDSSVVGSIGVAGDLYIGHSVTGFKFIDSQFGIAPFNVDTQSNYDNVLDLGVAAIRWDDIYATNGTIQTSDRNEKQDIEALSDAETRVAVACKGLIRKFRWIDAVAEKGDDARIHFGIIAQDLQDAFAAEGLDAGRYAMFISSTWWETDRVVPAVEAVEGAEATYDDEGNQLTEAVEAVVGVSEHTVTDTFMTLEEAPEGATERTRLGVRYPELLAFIIGAL
jgi:hypothetical protein